MHCTGKAECVKLNGSRTVLTTLCRGVKSHAADTVLTMEGFRVVLASPYTLNMTVVI